MGVFFDVCRARGAGHRLQDVRHCSDGPWTRAIEGIFKEEKFHIRHGEVWVQRLVGDPATRDDAQRTFEKWYIRTMNIFGRPGSAKNALYRRLRLKLRDNGEVRQAFADEDGGEGRLLVAAAVPYPQIAFFYDYATAHGHVATGIQWEQVGTSLVVRPSILPDGSIRVRLTPHVTYLTATGGGAVEFVEASSDLRVPAGTPVALGGAERQLNTLTRQILGEHASQTAGQLTLTLVATVQ